MPGELWLKSLQQRQLFKCCILSEKVERKKLYLYIQGNTEAAVIRPKVWVKEKRTPPTINNQGPSSCAFDI